MSACSTELVTNKSAHSVRTRAYEKYNLHIPGTSIERSNWLMIEF